MNDTDSIHQGRYHCKFGGCNKSFQRREHLSRHTRTHTESKYTCKFCLKDFTRSDSLQRHLNLHGEAFKASPSNRSKRACATCHASKIKCDGEQPCKRCKKKVLDCLYVNSDLEAETEASNSLSPAPLSYGYQPSKKGGDEAQAAGPSQRTTLTSISGDKNVEIQASFEERLSAALKRNKGPIDWTSVRVLNDIPHRSAVSETYGALQPSLGDDHWPSFPESEQNKYAKLYFTHFHHRWPILHAPLFSMDTAPPVLRSSVIMVGACIHRTDNSKHLALDLHTRVLDYVLPQLIQLSPRSSMDHSLTQAVCEASLLLIIFGIYCGEQNVLSKTLFVRSLLTTALREMGLFKSELPVSYDKPGYFAPLRFAKEAQKQRLSTCLFKIDSYLAILRGQPQLLTPEELFFPLPSTFAIWNADGLNVWETRYSIEPQSRSKNTVWSIISEPCLESLSRVDGLLLIEDIQIGICAIHSKSWQLRERIREETGQEASHTMDMNALKKRLHDWKQLILRLPIQHTDHMDFSEEQHLAMRYYYGTEDHSSPGWQFTVFDRPKTLVFDTLMLYHLMSIQLFADVRILTQLARDKHPEGPATISGEMYLRAKEQREVATSVWVESEAARRALTHAIEILVSHNSISGLQHDHVDPITFIALSVSALITWAYCIYDGRGYLHCHPGGHDLPSLDLPLVELTRWSGPKTSHALEEDREAWINLGGCRGALMGVPLCPCNIEGLMAKFRGSIPQGWNVSDTIAPGVFKYLSGERLNS